MFLALLKHADGSPVAFNFSLVSKGFLALGVTILKMRSHSKSTYLVVSHMEFTSLGLANWQTCFIVENLGYMVFQMICIIFFSH